MWLIPPFNHQTPFPHPWAQNGTTLPGSPTVSLPIAREPWASERCPSSQKPRASGKVDTWPGVTLPLRHHGSSAAATSTQCVTSQARAVCSFQRTRSFARPGHIPRGGGGARTRHICLLSLPLLLSNPPLPLSLGSFPVEKGLSPCPVILYFAFHLYFEFLK